jgi:hypothetical protein
VCLNSGYYYNQQPDYDFWISWDTFPTPPCGPGYYANLSESYVNAGFWIGGSAFSGKEYFPTSPGSLIP